jgi:hypothetical protein
VADRQSGAKRPTKAERKDQARRDREQIQRKMAARSRNRKLGTALIGIAVVVIVVAVVLTQAGGSGLPTPHDLQSQAAAQEKAAGCSAVQQTPNYQNAPGVDPDVDHVHIGSSAAFQTPPALSTYPTVPPASGPHSPTPAAPGVYSSPPDIYQAIHSLEHAGVIIWYDPSVADSEGVRQIREFYDRPTSDIDVGQVKVIVAPYDYPTQGAQGHLPPKVQMALVAWHFIQTCAQPNLAAAFNFSSQYSNGYPNTPYVGRAREPNLPL